MAEAAIKSDFEMMKAYNNLTAEQRAQMLEGKEDIEIKAFMDAWREQKAKGYYRSCAERYVLWEGREAEKAKKYVERMKRKYGENWQQLLEKIEKEKRENNELEWRARTYGTGKRRL
jgi:hypothetical protein